MSKVYEIKNEEEPCYLNVLPVEASYLDTGLENLVYLMTFLFERQFVLLCSESSKKKRISEIRIHARDMEMALTQVLKYFPGLEYAIQNKVVFIYDKNHQADHYFQSSLEMEFAYHARYNTDKITTSALKVLHFIATTYKKTLICPDILAQDKRVEISILPYERFGSVLQKIRSIFNQFEIDVFENVLRFEPRLTH